MKKEETPTLMEFLCPYCSSWESAVDVDVHMRGHGLDVANLQQLEERFKHSYGKIDTRVMLTE